MPDRSLSLLRRDFMRLLRAPIWWYTDGLRGVLRWMRQELALSWRSLGIRLWIASFFQPMYGVRDWPGRLISIVVRAVMIVGRLLWWIGEAFVYLLAVVLWCIWIPLALTLLFV